MCKIYPAIKPTAVSNTTICIFLVLLKMNVSPNVIAIITSALDKSELTFKVNKAGIIPTIQQYIVNLIDLE